MKDGYTGLRESVKQLIHRGKADKVIKGELVIGDEVIQKALACDTVGFEERKQFIDSLGLDLITVSPQLKSRDMHLEDSTAQDYTVPDLRQWVIQTGYFTFAILDGAFERGIETQGMAAFFQCLRTSPLLLQEWIQTVERVNFELAQQLATEGVDGIILADDVAYAGGLMLNPQSLRAHFMPSLVRQVEKMKRLGLTVFYHSDGDYRAVLEDIIQAGFDGLHCIDRNSGMEISKVQKEVKDRLCLWGHLDVQDLEEAAQDSASLVQKADRIRECVAGKRFILGTSSGLFTGINLQGLQALYQRV